jgi:hypothetical protein
VYKLLAALRAPVEIEPAVVRLPLQAPDASQLVAFEDDQVSVLAAPEETLVGFADNDTVGGAAGGAGAGGAGVVEAGGEVVDGVEPDGGVAGAGVGATGACDVSAVGTTPDSPPHPARSAASATEQNRERNQGRSLRIMEGASSLTSLVCIARMNRSHGIVRLTTFVATLASPKALSVRTAKYHVPGVRFSTT